MPTTPADPARADRSCRSRLRPVIGVAAVAGRRADHDLLASVAGQDEATTLAALRDAVGQQVLVADPAAGRTGLRVPARP